MRSRFAGREGTVRNTRGGFHGPHEDRPQRHHGGHPPFTASFGISDSTQGDSLQRLIQLADAALYASKNAGRDRVTVSDGELLEIGESDLPELRENAGTP